MDECIVLCISQNYFLECLKQNGDFAVEIVRNLSLKLQSSSLRSDRLLFSSSQEQVLYYIWQYWSEHQTSQNALLISEKNEYISDEIGISTRTFYRTLKKLKEQNTISIKKGCIYVTKEQINIIYSLLFP